MLRALGTAVSVKGDIPREGLLISNHLGYWDVMVIAAQFPVIFVSKSEVRSWPVIGLLLKHSGAILADRSSKIRSAQTSQEMRAAFAAGLPVAFFPEGTSSDGSQLLPFKPALLQIALETKKTITPAAISYHCDHGDINNDVCYWGNHHFASHIYRLARVRGLRATFQIGNAPQLLSDRKTAALLLHQRVVELLTESHL